MNNGRWAGSYDTNELYDPPSDFNSDWRNQWQTYGHEKEMKPPTEKITVPEFSGEGNNDQEVGKSARSYVRKVQVPRRAGRCLIKQQLKNNTSMMKIIDFWTPAKDHGM